MTIINNSSFDNREPRSSRAHKLIHLHTRPCPTCGMPQYSADGETWGCVLCEWRKAHPKLPLHYRTFTRESLSDLQVLCHECHVFADMERQTLVELEKKARQQSSSLYIGFIQWMKKGNDYKNEINSNKAYQAKQKFLYMLFQKQGKAYSLDLRVFGYQDYDPNWKPGE